MITPFCGYLGQPHLFIIGAPKCGTTSLVHWLGQHSEIFFSPKKEPHYFFSPYRRTPISIEKYQNYFKMAKASQKYLAEASVWYLYSRSAVDRILNFNPEARFIVCLRNPVDMFASLHPQQIFSGLEGEKDIEKAWNLSDARKAGSFAGIKKIRGKGDPGHMAYQHSCLLGQQVEDLLAKAVRTQVMFLLIEDMRDAPEAVFGDICSFLGIENTASSTEFRVLNTARKPRSRKINKRLEWLDRKQILPKHWREKMFKANMNTTGNPPLRPEFREIVQKHFRSDTELLQSLIDRDLSGWLSD